MKNSKRFRLMLRRALLFPTDQCVLWPKGRFKSGGYGKFSEDGRTKYAHREALISVTGAEGEQAAHNCRNPHCFNPQHLEWKTAKQNLADTFRDSTHRRGERYGANKLTTTQVQAIIADTRSQSAIAEEYGMNQSQISRIKAGKRWGWVQ